MPEVTQTFNPTFYWLLHREGSEIERCQVTKVVSFGAKQRSARHPSTIPRLPIPRLPIHAAVVLTHPNRSPMSDVSHQPRAKVGFLFQRDCTAARSATKTPIRSALPPHSRRRAPTAAGTRTRPPAHATVTSNCASQRQIQNPDPKQIQTQIQTKPHLKWRKYVHAPRGPALPSCGCVALPSYEPGIISICESLTVAPIKTR